MALLGERLRELRVNRNLTLKQVSEETGLSVSFLSLVERDKVSISVDNLERLARYYEVRLGRLFHGVEDNTVLVTRSLDIRKVQTDHEPPQLMFSLLSFRMGARMEPLLISIKPGEGDSSYRRHEGDAFIYTLQGKIRLISEKGEVNDLNPGDSAYFYGFPGRRIENASQVEPALILLVTDPPTSLRDDALDNRRGILIQPDRIGSPVGTDLP